MSQLHFNLSFNTSAPRLSLCPPPNVAEIVFLGRSNVGKSSLINAIAHQKKLAKSSQTPGKTKLINFFDGSYKSNTDLLQFRFVDLPGFGYAKVSKEEKKEWEEKLTEFLLERVSIKAYLQLIDARHPELEIDKQVSDFLHSIKKGDQKIFRVFTKMDKLKSNEKSQLKQKYHEAFFVSSQKKQDIEMLKRSILEHIFGEIFAT